MQCKVYCALVLKYNIIYRRCINIITPLVTMDSPIFLLYPKCAHTPARICLDTPKFIEALARIYIQAHPHPHWSYDKRSHSLKPNTKYI